jgi:hypothetical protein
MSQKMIFLIILGLLGLFACTETPDPIEEPQEVDFLFEFEEGLEGWQGGFSDLPTAGQEIFELEFGHRPLPEETGQEGNALFIQGHNRSDDLFMFFKREITQLKPNTRYRMVMNIELASQYPEDSFGIGGSPGASVFLKVGAVDFEPQAEDNTEGYLQMNLDKGNQAQEGANMINTGTVGIEGPDFRYTLIHRGNQDRPFELTTNAEGSLWVIFGTDSGFEGLTELYYNRVSIELLEVL